MKKRYIIILLILISCLLVISLKLITDKRKGEELESIKIIEEKVSFQVFVYNSVDNLDEIQKELENMIYVNNVKLITKEEALEEMENKVGTNIFDDDFRSNNIFPDSFIITLKINNIKDCLKIRDLEENILKIEGIKKVDTSCSGFINIYEKKGSKALIEYNKISIIMDEQGIDGVKAYLNENEDIKELLKDFIPF